jgi:hypothetical protein
MAINPSSLTSQAISANTDTTIELVFVEPEIRFPLDPPQPPGKMIAFYNGATDLMTLYVVGYSGTRLYRVV